MMSADLPDVARLEAAVRGIPGVDQAVALVSYNLRPPPAPVDAPTPPPAGQPEVPPPEVGGRAGTGPAAEVYLGAVPFPDGAARTLTEALARAAVDWPDRGTHYVGADGDVTWQSYPDLLDAAQRVLRGLRAAGLRPGDAALFQFDDNRDYVTTFWACVLGGFLPTPVAIAPSYRRHNAVTRRLRNAWELLDRPVFLTDADTLPAVAGLAELWGEDSIRALATEDLARSAPDPRWYDAAPDDPAMHLLTSGSTGVPKCVRHTHRSIAARTYAAAHACGYTSDDVTMNWMPLDHVAIVMYNVRDVFLGCTHVNAKISTFLSDPLLWLDWIDRFRATNTWAPNFAFALVNDRAADIAGRSWDLSSMRAMTNAAEPVIARTAHRFLDLLAPHGLPADAMRPCWGMSETCSGVTYSVLSRDDRGTGTVAVDPASLGGALRTMDPASPDALVFTEVGPPVPGLRIRIVDEHGSVLAEDHIGVLQTSGEVMMRGYHANPAATRDATSADGWFITGDLAFVHHGSLVITGREKDQIIVRGVNYVAHEIEAAVEQVDGVELTFVAAGAVPDPDNGSDRLALFFVPTRDTPAEVRATISDIRARLVRDVGLSPDIIVPASREEFPKTGSGKTQRGQLLSEWGRGTFDERLRALADTADTDADAATTAFERVWRPAPAPAPVPEPAAGGWLILIDDPAVGERLRAALAGPVTIASTRLGADLRLDPTNPAAYERLLAEAGPIGTVVHAWGTAPMPIGERHDLDPALDLTTYSLPLLLRALSGAGRADAAVLVLTCAGLWTAAGDRIEPVKGGVSSLVRTVAQESAVRLIRHIDVPRDSVDAWADILVTEAATPVGDDVVAYRAGVRLAPRLRATALTGPRPGDDEQFRPGGRYLVTGGMGGIGLQIAEYLLGAYQATVLLVGRRPAGDPEVARPYAELADLGVARYAQVDVADAGALARAVEDAEAAWGATLDGIVHLAGAGIADQWADLAEHTVVRETLDRFRLMNAAKVHGTWALTELLRTRPSTSLVLFSSVNGEFGGAAFGAYASANGFLQAFGDHERHENHRAVRTLAWSMWSGIGMSATVSPIMTEARGFRSIGVDEGIGLLLGALAPDTSYLILGLDRRNPHILRHIDPEQLDVADVVVAYTGDAGVSDDDVRRAAQAVRAAGAGAVRVVRLDELTTDAAGAIDRERLRITVALGGSRHHVPPRTDVERRLAAIWEQVLGRPSVGLHDTFFELGGGSMQAAQVIAQVNAGWSARLAIENLYEHPTVAVFAQAIESALTTSSDRKETHVHD